MALVEKIKLIPGTAEYQDVAEFFETRSRTDKKKLDIVSIEKVTNSTLEQKFKEKQEEYNRIYGHVKVVKVWHGTKQLNIPAILKDNFDVARYGQNVGHRFGAGVAFSSMASYASHYCDKGSRGAMLLCQVLVSNMVQVEENKGQASVLREPPYLPNRCPLRYDTTAKNADTMDVIVKFEKDTFLVSHVVSFRRSELPAESFDYSFRDYSDDDSDLDYF